ncbi:MAG TPA: ring-cleaving dioxygenase [Puia sp.]|jgi:glyoxalase family protein|nr:ring-cleaving dioxygenase [Puia sp.]
MQNQILGLHHVTAIADNAQRNYNFYTQVLGQRMVKKTVNFDDPGTYHFYYGNEKGEPGTILTFFPWEGIGRGIAGTGMATEISYAIAPDALDFWTERFNNLKVTTEERIERFGETYLPFSDHDGLQLSLVGVTETDKRKGWETKDIKITNATKGFHNVTLTLRIMDETAKLLTDIFGYKQISREGNRFRFKTETIPTASIIDIVELPDGKSGRNSAGTNHHIAFRVSDEETQMAYREKLLERGLNITHQIDRDYFFSVYFREPGGVLFEIATDNPGFTVDEPLDQLGTHLRLPKQYEPMRGKIEASLPALK